LLFLNLWAVQAVRQFVDVGLLLEITSLDLTELWFCCPTIINILMSFTRMDGKKQCFVGGIHIFISFREGNEIKYSNEFIRYAHENYIPNETERHDITFTCLNAINRMPILTFSVIHEMDVADAFPCNICSSVKLLMHPVQLYHCFLRLTVLPISYITYKL